MKRKLQVTAREERNHEHLRNTQGLALMGEIHGCTLWLESENENEIEYVREYLKKKLKL